MLNIIYLLTTFMLLISLSSCTPTLHLPHGTRSFISPNPFSGQGQLIALRDGHLVGCLSSTMKLRNLYPLTNQCGIFNATVGNGIPAYRPFDIGILTGPGWRDCGFAFVVVDPPVFSPRYRLGCPKPVGAQVDSFYSVPGTGAHSRYHPMMVGLQLNFTTDDGTMPIGNAGKEVFTDELQSRPENFQIVWDSVWKPEDGLGSGRRA